MTAPWWTTEREAPVVSAVERDSKAVGELEETVVSAAVGESEEVVAVRVEATEAGTTAGSPARA